MYFIIIVFIFCCCCSVYKEINRSDGKKKVSFVSKYFMLSVSFESADLIFLFI